MIPQKFVNIFMSYWRQDSKKVEAVISPQTAAALSILLTLIYVLPLYATAKTRPSPTLARDAPSVIRARVRTVAVSCFISCFVTVYVAWTYGHLAPVDILEVFGLWPIQPLDILQSLALVALLFLGPLFESAIVDGGWRRWIKGTDLMDTLSSSIGLRNYIAAPLSEEFVFRSLILTLHMFAWTPLTHLIFLTPLYFGIAHLHHLYEFTLTHPHIPLLPAVIRSLVQFAYTSLFGFYAAFLFLRTGSLPAVVLTHAFCNWMGLPRFWGRLETPTAMGPAMTPATTGSSARSKARKRDGGREKERSSDEEGEEDDRDEPAWPTAIAAALNPNALGVGWTVAYYFLLVTGAVGFGVCLWPLTESLNTLVDFGVKLP